LASQTGYKECEAKGMYGMVVVWLSGNTLVLINVVTLRRARLILGWVTTVCV